MKLKVNGVEIRVVDRIDIELDIAQDGEDLVHGINIKVRGGDLAIWPFASREAALHVLTESPIVFHLGASAAITCIRESQDADDYRPAAMVWSGAGGPIPLGNPFYQTLP